jgi:hypothetical protein
MASRRCLIFEPWPTWYRTKRRHAARFHHERQAWHGFDLPFALALDLGPRQLGNGPLDVTSALDGGERQAACSLRTRPLALRLFAMSPVS